jgi:putative ABC transport system permease protein
MTLWSRIRSWLRTTAQRSRMESEMDVELKFHIEACAEDLVRSGLPRQEAMRRARTEFGGIERAKEECREARGVTFLESLVQDIRYGLRMLLKSPAFTAVAVITLALGIGANTAIFSVLNTVLLKPLPYPNADALVMVFLHSGLVDRGGMGFEDFEALRDQQQSFENVAASNSPDEGFALTGQNVPEEIPGTEVTADFFKVLGARAMIGRTFLPGEDRVDQPLTVVVSARF